MKNHSLKVSLCLARLFSIAILGTWAAVVAGSHVHAQTDSIEIEGFTEPFRKIDLSSDETGAIALVAVRAGDRVGAGDVISKLDCRVQEIQLEIAEKLAGSKSQRVAAAGALKKRQAISQRLQQLHNNGHASASEIMRADLELSIAQSKYNTAIEDAEVRSIEARRAEVQLKRRTVTAPFAGVITKIHSREGEFLSPLRPEVCTIAQIDQLLATFNVPSEYARRFENGTTYDLRLSNGNTVSATVYQVGVETDPQSGTVEIKLVIDNRDYEIRSGENVSINI